MAVSYWQNVKVDVQSALGTPTAISAITNANPGVATSTAHGLTNGKYLILSAVGMREVHEQVVRVANVTANTFELEGVNTTSYGAFTSGTFTEVTFGTSLNTITSVTSSGGEPQTEDETTIHDDIEVLAVTRLSAFQMQMESLWDPADAGLVALKSASDSKTTRAVRISFANGKKLAVQGNIACSMIPAGQAPGKVTTPVTVLGKGRPSAWAT